MGKPIDRLSTRKQIMLGIAWFGPWIAFAVLASDVLPVRWRFGQWPEVIRSLLILLFVIFNVVDAVFSFWYVFGRGQDEQESDNPA